MRYRDVMLRGQCLHDSDVASAVPGGGPSRALDTQLSTGAETGLVPSLNNATSYL